MKCNNLLVVAWALYVAVLMLREATCEGLLDPCPSGHSCCIYDLHAPEAARTANSVATWYSYVTPSWMRDCLSAVRLEASQASAVTEVLSASLAELYGSLHIARTSSASGTAAGPDGVAEPYGLGVDVLGLVRAAHEGSRLSDGRHSAYGLHYDLALAVGALGDPKTVYRTPFAGWTLHRLVRLRVAEGPCAARIVLAPVLAGAAWVNSTRRPGDVDESAYRLAHGEDPPQLPRELAECDGCDCPEVLRVNGVPAAEYLRERLAARVLGVRSAGARVSAYLNREARGEPEDLSLVPPPDADEEVFELSGGTVLAYKLTVRYHGRGKTLEDFQEEYSDLGAFEAYSRGLSAAEQAAAHLAGANSSRGAAEQLRQWSEAVHEMSEQLAAAGDARVGLATDAEDPVGEDAAQATAGGYALYCDYSDCDYSDEEYYSEEFEDLEVRQVQPGTKQILAFAAGLPRAEGEPFLAVYESEEAEAMVVKITTFRPDGGAFGARRGRQSSAEARARAVRSALLRAVAAAEAFATENGIYRLIFDLSGNRDGALDSSGYDETVTALLLLRAVQDSWSTPGELCPVSNMRVPELVQDLVSGSMESAWSRIQALASETSGDELGSLFGDLSVAMAALAALVDPLGETGAADVIVSITASVSAAVQRNLLPRALLEGHLRELFQQVVRSLQEGVLPADAVSTATERLLDGTYWYLQATDSADARAASAPLYTENYWGGECAAAFAAFEDLRGNLGSNRHQFDSIGILTDGTCAGACATFATRMALAGGANTFSFGGMPRGDPPALGYGYGRGAAATKWHDLSQSVARSSLSQLALGHASGPLAGGAAALTSLPVPIPSRGASALIAATNDFEPAAWAVGAPVRLLLHPSPPSPPAQGGRPGDGAPGDRLDAPGEGRQNGAPRPLGPCADGGGRTGDHG
eukprot:CAMPEP_0177601924 /NCGR_PEP_ID=MMETSP0419_2-20121207/14559_1 /TAXON_ID=582737 /ORGANISM="Tetraselmis sp., Strain GSL018" /LENGTH=924 /DNA_ID=CAMNT_0019095303 /DNA_START=115 /DNA_END=2885 /DNA_ORIENTATION=-